MNAGGLTARRAIVRGRVQGVGFRFFAERAAREFGIRGWVRNLPDGTVETFAEGEADAVAGYLEKLRRGPLGSRVDAVDVTDVPPARLPTYTNRPLGCTCTVLAVWPAMTPPAPGSVLRLNSGSSPSESSSLRNTSSVFCDSSVRNTHGPVGWKSRWRERNSIPFPGAIDATFESVPAS